MSGALLGPLSNTCKGEVNGSCLSEVQSETFQAKHDACFLGDLELRETD